MLITLHMNTIKDNETGNLQYDLTEYIKWRRKVIGEMIDANNISSCLNAMHRGIKAITGEEPKVTPKSLHEAVNRILDGHKIGELRDTPSMESDGTPDLSQS